MASMAPPYHSIRPSTSSGSFRNGTNGTNAIASSSSTTASSSRAADFAHTPLTLDAVLAQSNGDARAALNALITERNMLSTQNVQLWKLIDKQRGVMKELDRVRSERDRAIAKLDAMDPGRLTASGSSMKMRASPSAPTTSQLRSFSTEDSSITAPLRPRAARQQSDQTHAADLRSASARSLSSSRSHERLPRPLGSQPDAVNGASNRNGSTSSPSLLTGPSDPSPSSTTGSSDVPQPRNRSTSHQHSATSARGISVDTTSVPQLSLTQPPSNATPSTSSTVSVPVFSQSPAGMPLEPSPAVASPQSLSPVMNTPGRPRASARESRISLPDEASRYIANMIDSPPPPRGSTHPSATITSIITAQGDLMGNGASRSLSPTVDQGEESGPSSSGEAEKASSSRRPQGNESDTGGGTSASASPVEEMYAESIISVSSRYSHDRNGLVKDDSLPKDDGDSISSWDTSSVQPPLRPSQPEPSPPVPASQSGSVSSGRLDNVLREHVRERSGASATSQKDHSNPFTDPLPPRSSPDHNGDRIHPTVKIHGADRHEPPTDQQRFDMDSQTESLATPGPSSLAFSPSSSASTTLSPHSSASRNTSQTSSPAESSSQGHLPFPPTNTPSGSNSSAKGPVFKATRLTLNDLPYTKVKIHGSNIKTNDRGKEVLSFVYTVYPAGDGTAPAHPLRKNTATTPPDSWQVEKLYSEVLGLDASVRTRLGKTGSKRLSPLPDPKLFKDHAPAKVDQRKTILETYMQSLVAIPLKDKNEICMFLSTDIVRGGAVLPADHKEGYLTKRGKNFGGWKTRYFVLNSPTLEYYESRGGQHLGSIYINGAQIGRQQKNPQSRDSDDENSYRHAFLVIEAKRGPGGSSIRHVLCAESDAERDSWVELLVKYVVAGQAQAKNGIFRNVVEEEHRSSTSTAGSEPVGWTTANGTGSFSPSPTHTTGSSSSYTGAAPRSPLDPPPRWGQLREDAPKPSMDSFSESASIKSNFGPYPTAPPPTDAQIARRLLDRGGHSPEVPLSTSLPSNLDQSGMEPPSNPPPARATSELGHYSDLVMGHWSHPNLQGGEQPGPPQPSGQATVSPAPSSATLQQPLTARPNRGSFHPAKSPSSVNNPANERAASPEKLTSADGKVKISGPMNGTPIPPGYKFGNETPVSNDRERKAKSGRFWGFGRTAHGLSTSGQTPQPVFGVPIEASLSVSQKADLPSVVFRCIKYLEDKKADQEEGIYRLSGSSNVIKNLKERFNNEGDVDLLNGDYWDPHAIAGLLKTYLRDLPESLLTRDLHMSFLSVIDLANQQERVDELASLVSQLPFPHYSLLRALTAHLILIVQNSPVNKMTMRNVGIVFSPTLGIPAGVFSLMLGEFERVFNVNSIGSDQAKLGDELMVEDGMINNRNSRSYASGEADELLGLSGRKLNPESDDESEEGEDDMPDSSDTETENDTRALTPPATPDPARETASDDLNQPRNGPTHSAAVAAQRGLQVMVSVPNSRRVSGLPTSPRPPRMAFTANNNSTPVSPLAAATFGGRQ